MLEKCSDGITAYCRHWPIGTLFDLHTALQLRGRQNMGSFAMHFDTPDSTALDDLMVNLLRHVGLWRCILCLGGRLHLPGSM